VYALSRELDRVNGRIFTVDWGIGNSLFALHPSGRYTELEFALEHPAPADIVRLRRWLASIPGPRLFVTHSDSSLLFPDANKNLFRVASHHLQLTMTVRGSDRAPVYEVFAYK
jgi:hypothetical protein